MARIFTTKFVFNQQLYDAIVSVITKDDKLQFTIKVMDVDLYEFLPDGVITCEGIEGFKQIGSHQNNLTQSLMESISAAIENHLVSAS